MAEPESTRAVFWYRGGTRSLPALQGRLRADFAIVGGGVSGLEVARSLLDRAPGAIVALVESRFCGSGASGRSSGFLTPDSELQVAQLARRFGDQTAGRLWRAVDEVVQRVRQDIRGFDRTCDFVEADSFFVANGDAGRRTVQREHRDRQRLGLASRFYSAAEIPEALGSTEFAGGVRYAGTFGIDSFAYVCALRDQLRARGLRVFEDTRVLALEPHAVQCPGGEISAETIFLCTDRFTPELGAQPAAASQVQTVLAVTEPLPDGLYRALFPEKPLLVWDTDLVYQYFRPIGENRLLLGGGLLSRTYASSTDGAERTVAHLRRYCREKIPELGELAITHWWPGFIGVTKDFLPLAGRSPRVPSHALAICGAGLPWSMLAATVATRVVLEGGTEFDDCLRPGRSFTDLDPLQPVAGKRVTFALSHYYAKEWLRGSPERVRRRRPLLASIGVATAATALLFRKRRRRRPAASRQR